MAEEVFEVLWPSAPWPRDEVRRSDRVDLNGKTVAVLQNLQYAQWFPLVRDELQRRYADMRIIEPKFFGYTSGAGEGDTMARLPELLRSEKVDAVISGVGL